MRRYSNKRDLNEKEIVPLLRAIGVSVYQISSADFPDLVLGWHGVNYLVEVKSKGGKLTPGQTKFIEEWDGNVIVAYSLEDILKELNIVIQNSSV